MKIKRGLYKAAGCIFAALGAAGAALPFLPSVPFLLLAAACFARGSEKLHSWFVGTKLYKENVESFVQGRGMTVGTKVRILTAVTVLLALAFIMMKGTFIGRIMLAAVWTGHFICIVFGVKTAPKSEREPAEKQL